MRFEIPGWQAVTVLEVNPTGKKKGQEVTHLVDVVVSMEGPNGLLNLFDPHWREMFFTSEEEGTGQRELDGVDAVSDLPVLTSTEIKWPVPMSFERKGMKLEIDWGRGGRDSNLLVDEIRVSGVRVWCKEGGSIKVVCHLQSTLFSDTQIIKLIGLLKCETKLKLYPPPLAAQVDIEQEERKAAGEAHGGVPGQGTVKAPRKGSNLARSIAKNEAKVANAAAKKIVDIKSKRGHKPSKEETSAAATRAFAEAPPPAPEAGTADPASAPVSDADLSSMSAEERRAVVGRDGSPWAN